MGECYLYVLARACKIADGAADVCTAPLAIAGSGGHAQRGSAHATADGAATARAAPLAIAGSVHAQCGSADSKQRV